VPRNKFYVKISRNNILAVLAAVTGPVLLLHMMSWHLQGNIGPLSHEALTSGGDFETFGELGAKQNLAQNPRAKKSLRKSWQASSPLV
jgi:hypothetical protein